MAQKNRRTAPTLTPDYKPGKVIGNSFNAGVPYALREELKARNEEGKSEADKKQKGPLTSGPTRPVITGSGGVVGATTQSAKESPQRALYGTHNPGLCIHPVPSNPETRRDWGTSCWCSCNRCERRGKCVCAMCPCRILHEQVTAELRHIAARVQ